MWKFLILAACLVTDGLARPDVSHLLKKTGDKQKRQNFIGTMVSVTGNGAVVTEVRSSDGANVEALIPQISLLPLQDNQPSPFRRLEERSGYDYQKPDFPLDVHPDSNLVSPVSTQAPEYLPPEDGEESTNVDKVAPPSYPSTTSTTTTTTTTTTTPAPTTTTTTTTTTPAPYTSGIPTTQQQFDSNDGYGYKKPEVLLPPNFNDVIGEASDINQLATTTVPTTTTTAKNSLEYLPPKPLPELVVPKQPSTPSTTQQPQTEPSTYPSSVSTTFQIPAETQPPYPKLPEASVYPDASATVSTVVTQQSSTEMHSTAAPEYLPPDSDTNGFQIIVRSGSDSDDSDTTSTTTGSTASSGGSSTTVVFQPNEPTTTLLPALPEADSLVQQEQGEQTTEGQQTTTTSTSNAPSGVTLLTGETVTPLDDASSVIALINQMQETSQVAGQADFVPELRINEEAFTTIGTSEATTTQSSTVTTTVTTSLATTDLPAVEQTERSEPEPEQPEVRLGEEDTTGPSLFDLLTSTTVVAVVTQNDTITTYRPSTSAETTTLVPESSADETEIQSRIADPNDGYNYEAPENGLTVPSSVVPSHTLQADGYHYKVPSVPFP
ncbi:mucin-5AC-like [Anopheles moucheti]|uniref:mucin-5AC-like n=1 Tax=Anopheles moucheti TaxID=186751 RepID=UPI0022F12FF8|nr:mucin-5AC-like [Anopheles moucheti]